MRGSADGKADRIVADIRSGFDELYRLVDRLRVHVRAQRKLAQACRALVAASGTKDVAISRPLLEEALKAAKAGLAELEGPEARPAPPPLQRTAAE